MVNAKLEQYLLQLWLCSDLLRNLLYNLSLCAMPFISMHGSAAHGCHRDPVCPQLMLCAPLHLLLWFVVSEQGEQQHYLQGLKCFILCVGHWLSTRQGSLLERLQKSVCPLTVPSGLS